MNFVLQQLHYAKLISLSNVAAIWHLWFSSYDARLMVILTCN